MIDWKRQDEIVRKLSKGDRILSSEVLALIEAAMTSRGIREGADITHSETRHSGYTDHKWTVLWREWEPEKGGSDDL